MHQMEIRMYFFSKSCHRQTYQHYEQQPQRLKSSFFSIKNLRNPSMFFFCEEYCTKVCLSLFNVFIDMRTTVTLSISCGKKVFLLENFNKNTFFPHEMDRLTVVLMSIKWLNEKRWPLEEQLSQMKFFESFDF